MLNPLALNGRRYLITGAASGVGQATAVLLSKLGANLILLDLNEVGLKKTAEQLETEAFPLPVDLADSNSIRSSLENAIEQVGPIHGLAHVAEIPYIAPLKAINAERALKLYQVNQYAAVELAKAFQSRKIYAGEHGSIVLISSVYGLVGSAANVGYAMTKAALIGITKALSIELAPRRIRVNCIAPGFLRTKMMSENAFRFNQEYMQRLETLHPLGLGSPEDIANSIVFLLSDMSSWVTGAVFSVDGGFTAQ